MNISVICNKCGKSFSRREADVRRSKNNYCSKDCHAKSRITRVALFCDTCRRYFTKRKSKFESSKTGKHYCSVKCSNKSRDPVIYYCGCGVEVGRGYLCRKRKCDECCPNTVDWSRITLRDLREDKGTKQYHARIRSLARSVYLRAGKPLHCLVCGYSKHCHICHIKDIQYFEVDTPISEVNAIENLVALCPNHHWEFDNNSLDEQWCNSLKILTVLKQTF